MKITRFEIKRVDSPLTRPLVISLGAITHSTSVVLTIETDEGICGVGEGAASVFVTGETMDGVEAVLRKFEQALIGTNPTDIEKVHRIMEKTSARAFVARTAVDLACYDILGKVSGMPVYTLLGGYGNRIETDITIGIADPQQMAKVAELHVKNGFRIIKTKVGTGESEDIERIRRIREAVGADIGIRLDANQAWTPKEALRMIERLEEYGIELVEQPVPYYDLDGLAYVTRHSRIPVMSDESAFDSRDVFQLVQRHAVDYVNIKLMKCGGIWEALKINSICEAAGVECMLGCMAEETNIGITAAASLGAAVKNITKADLDCQYSLAAFPVSGGVQWGNGGELTLPGKPGFGFA